MKAVIGKMMMRVLLPLLIFTIASLISVQVKAEVCPDYPLPEISFVVEKGDVLINNQFDTVSLARKKAEVYRADMPWEQGSFGFPRLKAQGTVTFREAKSHKCVAPEKITIRYRLDTTFYIAEDFPEGSCAYEEFNLYENEYAQIDQEIIHEYFQAAKERLEAQIAQQYIHGPLTKEEVWDIEQSWRATVKGAVNEARDGMEQEFARYRMESFDPDNYEYILGLCGQTPSAQYFHHKNK